MHNPPPAHEVRFDRFALQAAQRQLLVDGEPARLGARAFDLLAALVERRERTVSKHELLELVWPGVVVEENDLQVQISALRKLIGPQAIATIPGQGYRFTLPLHDAPAAEPAPAASSATPRLPPERTAFIGRQQDLLESQRRLEATRLLTLTGIGGSGKTRLALKLAERVRVAEAVAQSLGVKGDPGRDVEELVIGHLQGPPTLLLLDNCEHLLGAVSALADRLLGAVPGLTLLATSREGLGVRGESLLPVGSLAVPPPGTDGDLEAIARADALRAAHLSHFIAWLEAMQDQLRDLGVLTAVERVEPESDNPRAALLWGYAHEPRRAVTLTLLCRRVWRRPGRYQEGHRWLGEALALGDELPVVDRAQAPEQRGVLASRRGPGRRHRCAPRAHRRFAGDHRARPARPHRRSPSRRDGRAGLRAGAGIGPGVALAGGHRAGRGQSGMTRSLSSMPATTAAAFGQPIGPSAPDSAHAVRQEVLGRPTQPSTPAHRDRQPPT